jgi:hypothetical protein
MRGVDLRSLGTYPLMKPVFIFGLYCGAPPFRAWESAINTPYEPLMIQSR